MSADWLLFGEPDSGPLYRDASRPQAELEVDLAVAVRRYIHRREAEGAFDSPESRVRLGLENWIVDGAGLLRDLFETEERKVKTWIEWEDRTVALRSVSNDIMEALESLVPMLPHDDTDLGRHVHRLGRAALEAMAFSSGLGVPEEPNSFRGMSARDTSGPRVGPQTALRYLKSELREVKEAPNPLARRIRSRQARLAPRASDPRL